MSKDMMKGKRMLVQMLKGPMKAGMPMTHWKNQGMVEHVGKGKWKLTLKGIRYATKLDYDLKLKNQHPEQEVPPAEAEKEENFLFELKGKAGKQFLEDMLEDARQTERSSFWQDKFIALAFAMAEGKK